MIYDCRLKSKKISLAQSRQARKEGLSHWFYKKMNVQHRMKSKKINLAPQYDFPNLRGKQRRKGAKIFGARTLGLNIDD